jgi:hypothetical protein
VIRETFEQIETVYVAGTDLEDARWYLEHSPHRCGDTPQEAYDNADSYAVREHDYDVYEFTTTTRVVKVDPPYTKR